MVVRKPDVKRLLAKGLSGREAGKLVVQHAYAIDRGGSGFLSEKDIQTLQASLKTQRDVEDYNRVLDVYRTVFVTIQEAKILSLVMQKDLHDVESQLDAYHWSQGVSDVYRWLPVILTEKDYKAVKARQKRRLRRRLYSIGEVVGRRTDELLGGPDKAEDATEEEWDAAHATADQEVQKLLKAGKLKPLRLAHRADRYTVAEAEAALADPLDPEDLYEDEEDGPPEDAVERHAANLAEWEETVAQGDLTEGHDLSRYIPGEWGDVEPGDEERLLHHYLSGDQLYKAGLPEWKAWLDEFKFYEEDEYEGRDGGVAVLVEDGFLSSLDAKGHFNAYWLDSLKDYAQLRDVEEQFSREKGLSMQELLQTLMKKVRDKAKVLRAYQEVLRQAGEVYEIDLGVEESLFLPDIRKAMESYSRTAKTVSRWRGQLRGPKLPPLDYDQVKPDKATVDTLHERFSVGVFGDGFGGDWWKEASDG